MADDEYGGIAEWLAAEVRRDPTFCPVLALLFLLLVYTILAYLPFFLILCPIAVLILQQRYEKWRKTNEKGRQ